MDKQQEYVLRTIEERDIRYVRLWFTDVLGMLKSVAVTSSELEGAFTEGIGFDGSAVDGFARVQESDMLAIPDASTFQVLPWRGENAPVGRMFCDIRTPQGEPFAADPRQVLRRNLAKAGDMGFSFYLHPEIEFFLFKSSEAPEPLDSGGYFDLTPVDVQSDFRREAIQTLEGMGISVEYSHHEVAPSQHEIDLRYADALTMADNVMTYRLVVKEVAMRRGIYATFMPKPLAPHWGSAMHTHVSLFDGDTNAFYEASDPYHLSGTAKQFIAGLVAHAREICAVCCQWVNSYKRLIPGFEAPVYVSWGRHNRSALVRVPMYKPKKPASTRIEFRAPDPACNPYLAFSVILAAGLRGIEKGYELPPEAEDNIYEMTDVERRAAGIDSLPRNLDEALREMEDSELVAEALGEHVFEFFLRNKRVEWDEYRSQVTPYELRKYLPTL
ncbi:MAG TPA: glutamine synthetase family protein [Egibacteraceae bacterium]|nr:glutamine synthetase family protein [Egibacteraceae bacterium]